MTQLHLPQLHLPQVLLQSWAQHNPSHDAHLAPPYCVRVRQAVADTRKPVAYVHRMPHQNAE